MRDGPTFADLEPPQPPERTIDGLTDAQWAARVARRERAFRVALGLLFGFAVGVLGSWHWLVVVRTRVAALLVIGGAMLLFAALFAARRDDDAMEAAGWILLPEWKIVERLPTWAIALAWAIGMALLAAVAAGIVAGRLFAGR